LVPLHKGEGAGRFSIIWLLWQDSRDEAFVVLGDVFEGKVAGAFFGAAAA
jgi:hypothetical protein